MIEFLVVTLLLVTPAVTTGAVLSPEESELHATLLSDLKRRAAQNPGTKYYIRNLQICWRFQVCVEDNVDYWGADLRNFRASSFGHCAQICAREQHRGCRSFTFHKGNNRCWLKHTPFGAKYKRNQKVLKSANLNCNNYKTMPSWPQDFRWSNAGTPPGYTCVKTWEPRGPSTWNDNFMCWRNDRADPGLRWSFAGPIPGQRCTRIIEGAEPAKYTWKDNYLCVQPNSPYHFSWAYSNALRDTYRKQGKTCIQWLEPADPYTWRDNWLCAKAVTGKPLSKPLPSWPGDFKWSSAGVPGGYYCTRIWEAAAPAKYTWKDNFFCWRQNRADPGIRFNMNGRVPNSRCTQIIEPAEPAQYTWRDNFLCLPPNAPYHFSWAYSNAQRDNLKKAGNTCIQWIEGADPHTWKDNWLCNMPVDSPDARRHFSVQNRGKIVKKRKIKTGVDVIDLPGWKVGNNMYLAGYTGGRHFFPNLISAAQACSKRGDCGGITWEKRNRRYSLRKGKGFRRSPSGEISWLRGPTIKVGPTNVIIKPKWKPLSGRLTRISRGKIGIWGVNGKGNIYRLNNNGKGWTQISGNLVHISVGNEVWGVNRGQNIYKYLGGNKWKHMPGRLVNLDVSDKGHVWGIAGNQRIYRWTGRNWQHIGGAAIQVSVGPAGVWVVNRNHDIFYRIGTFGDLNSAGTGWRHIPGKLKWISSGKNIIAGVNKNNDIFYRKGITALNPIGTGWVHVPGKLAQIEIYEDQLVGTNPGHVIFVTPIIGVPHVPLVPGAPTKPEALKPLGCWRDKSARAIAGGIRFRGSIAKCEAFAKKHGYKVFAIQYGGECFTASNADKTYKKYGKAGNCKNGKGGGWAQNVYVTRGLGRRPTGRNGKITKPPVRVNRCPKSHPYVYYNGEYCCKTNREKVYKPQGARCDGSIIHRDSLCCAGNQFIKCAWGNCQNALNAKIEKPKPKPAPKPEISLGCWKDAAMRAIAGGIRFRGSIAKCEAFARKHGFSVFAIQYGGECFTAKNAQQTFRKYGRATNCKNGMGGGWAQNVYVTRGIKTKPKPKPRNTDYLLDLPGWKRGSGMYLSGYTGGQKFYPNLIAAAQACSKRGDCGGITWEKNNKRYSLRKGKAFRKSPSGEISWLRGPVIKVGPRNVVVKPKWKPISGRLTRISRGRIGIWGVNGKGNIYRLNNNGKGWKQISGNLVHISVGNEVWGVNRGQNIYKYLGGNKWKHMPGRLVNLDVSDKGHVWGIAGNQRIYRWTGRNWQHIGGAAIQVTVGPSGVWVVNRNHDIYYRIGTYGDPNTAGTGWRHIGGKLKWISSGRNLIAGVNKNNDIFYRKGITAVNPIGTGWVHVPGKLDQIEIYEDQLVGTNPGHVIFQTPIIGVPHVPLIPPVTPIAPTPKPIKPVKPIDTRIDLPGWKKGSGMYLSGYTGGQKFYPNLIAAAQACSKRGDCGGITWEKNNKRYSLRKGKAFRKSPSGEISWLRGPVIKVGPRNVVVKPKWKPISGRLTRISRGRIGIWGVNGKGYIYKLNDNGSTWTRISGNLVHISVGSEVWGVNRGQNIYKYLGGNKWKHMPGRLVNLDVSDKGHVWGIAGNQRIYRWTGRNWQHIGGAAIQVSVGPAGVWVVNRNHDIFYRIGTFGDLNSAGTGWRHIPGKLKWISSGKNIIAGVNKNNDIFYRKGITALNPIGTGWVHVPGKLAQIEIYEDQLVGTNPGHVIFVTPIIGVPHVPLVPGAPTKPEALKPLGCWRDKSARAIAGGIRFRGSIAKCEAFAKKHGYKVFAIQYGGECFTASNADKTYKKYGKAGNCKNGKGGGWAQNVYVTRGLGRRPTGRNGKITKPPVRVNRCPKTHPYVYYNGEYCCKTNREKVYKPQGARCDGSIIHRDSLCCAGNQFIKCAWGNCQNALNAKIEKPKPKPAPKPEISLGCWKDAAMRAIAGGIRFRGSIAKCEAFARKHGFSVFAIQYGGECFTAKNAQQTFRKYGRATNCKNGMGGGWAQNVYVTRGIKTKPKPKPRNTDYLLDLPGWKRGSGMYLSGYTGGQKFYPNLIAAAQACSKRGDCGGITWEKNNKRYSLRKGKAFRKSPSGEISWLRGPVIKVGPRNVVVKPKWKPISGRLTRISRGRIGIWGVNGKGNIYRLNNNGKGWTHISGNLVHISVGNEVWGVNRGQNIYKYLGGNKWKHMPGRLVNLDVSDKGHVWGIAGNQRIYRWTGVDIR